MDFETKVKTFLKEIVSPVIANDVSIENTRTVIELPALFTKNMGGGSRNPERILKIMKNYYKEPLFFVNIVESTLLGDQYGIVWHNRWEDAKKFVCKDESKTEANIEEKKMSNRKVVKEEEGRCRKCDYVKNQEEFGVKSNGELYSTCAKCREKESMVDYSSDAYCSDCRNEGKQVKNSCGFKDDPKKLLKCINHKTDDMVVLCSSGLCFTCKQEAIEEKKSCKTRATHGYMNGFRLYCYKHAPREMFNLAKQYRICVVCFPEHKSTIAKYASEEGQKATHCEQHADKNRMVRVVR